VIAGLSLLLIGGWLIARAFGIPLAGLNRLWPVLLALIGIALLAQASAARPLGSGLFFTGVVLIGCGLFLLVFSLEIGRLDWPDLSRYWPVFPAIVGAAFLALYVMEGLQNEALLRPAFLIGGLGIFTLPFTLGVLGGRAAEQGARFLPLLLIPVLLIVIIGLRSRNRGQSR
jgi:hypothetical protein